MLHSHMYLKLLQIASLKAAVARKDGEFENLQSTMSSPDLFARKAGGALSNRQHDEEDCLINHRQPMEEVGNIEVTNYFLLVA